MYSNTGNTVYNKIKKLHISHEQVITIISFLLIIVFSFTAKGFFNIFTLMNVFRQSSALALTAIGMTLVILIGKIDLSVGSNIALSSTVGAIVMHQLHSSGTLISGSIGIAIVIVVSTFIGFINGIMIGYFKIDSFIVTLAMMSMTRGLTLTIDNSSRILIDNILFNSVATLDILGIPLVLFLVIIIYILSHLIFSHTILGRKIYAIGDNEQASKAAGINTKFHITLTFILAGIFYALGAIIISGRARSAQPLAAIGMEFDVITAVVIGGVSLVGGIGDLKKTCMGVILISIISTGLGLLDTSPFTLYVIKGMIILIAVFSNQYKFKKKSISLSENSALHKGNNIIINMLKNSTPKILSLRNICKAFPGVKALEEVSIDIKKGTVHAIVGENGAGKSTLMKILSGVYQKDSGDILIDNIPVLIQSPVDSQRLGISIIYQEFSTVPELNVYQNIHLGREKMKSQLFLDTKNMMYKTKKLLERFNLSVDISKKISEYTIGQQQMFEIVKSLNSKSWIIIMDEPTSTINEEDKRSLLNIIRDLKNLGVAIIYISHRMSEIFEIADEISVFRDGRLVITTSVHQLDEPKLVKYMIGREISDVFYRKKNNVSKEAVLEVRLLNKENTFHDINFTIHKGEIVGLNGLIGAGRTEIARCIFGLDTLSSGEIYFNQKKVRIRSTKDAIQLGIVYISEDRRKEGIIPNMNVRKNISLVLLPYISTLGWIIGKEEKKTAKKYIEDMNIKTYSDLQSLNNLSGGNQQKVCIARWLAIAPRLIIMDEPTRGIDIGAKAEIHALMNELVDKGHSIILISSEMPELLGASDRIITIYQGIKTGEFVVDETLTQEKLFNYSSGLKREI